MNKLLVLKLFLSTAIFLIFSQNVYADCVATTAGGINTVLCSGADINGYDGNGLIDQVSVPTGASVSNGSNAIRTRGGADIITISGGTVTSTNDNAITAGSGNDLITINGGAITGDNGIGINGNSGNDTITIHKGVVIGATIGISGGVDDDIITINGGTVAGAEAIVAGSGSDTVILGGNSDITGIIDGAGNGAAGDTLVFSMVVSESNLATAKAQVALAALNPAGPGTVQINGKTYAYQNFENIEDNLRAITPVPTLQEWALILLITLLGLFGFGFTRKTARLF